MTINFTTIISGKEYTGGIVVPSDHQFSAAEIESMKAEKSARWAQAVKADPSLTDLSHIPDNI